MEGQKKSRLNFHVGKEACINVLVSRPSQIRSESLTVIEEANHLKWNEIMKKGEILYECCSGTFRSDAKKSEMLTVIEREFKTGFRSSDQFKEDPFKTVNKLMTEASLDENPMREFLRCRSRGGNAVEIEVVPIVEPAGKKEAREKIRQARNRNPFFG